MSISLSEKVLKCYESAILVYFIYFVLPYIVREIFLYLLLCLDVALVLGLLKSECCKYWNLLAYKEFAKRLLISRFLLAKCKALLKFGASWLVFKLSLSLYFRLFIVLNLFCKVVFEIDLKFASYRFPLTLMFELKLRDTGSNNSLIFNRSGEFLKVDIII